MMDRACIKMVKITPSAPALLMKLLLPIYVLIAISTCTYRSNKIDHDIYNHVEQVNDGINSLRTITFNTTEVDTPIIIGGKAIDYTLSQADSITSLYISIGDGKHADFAGIDKLRNLTSLDITLSETDEVDFTLLGLLPRLNQINIGGAYVNKIPDLGRILSLRDLRFQFSYLVSLDGLEKIPQIKTLQINDNRECITDTKSLSSLTNLEFFQLRGVRSNIKMSDLYGSAETLKKLFLEDSFTIDLAGIKQLRVLEELSMIGSVSKNMVEIGNVVSLQKLSIDELIFSINFLKGNINLTSLYLCSDSTRKNFWEEAASIPLDVEALRNLKKLECVILRGFILENSYIFDGLPNLRYLHTELSMGYR